jgi:hypothetical protein
LPGCSSAPDASAVAAAAARLGRHATDVGRRYLDSHPAEADLELLTALVAARLELTRGSLPERMSRAVSEDFRCGRAVSIDGWSLSRTEVRICAIAHLARAA